MRPPHCSPALARSIPDITNNRIKRELLRIVPGQLFSVNSGIELSFRSQFLRPHRCLPTADRSLGSFVPELLLCLCRLRMAAYHSASDEWCFRSCQDPWLYRPIRDPSANPHKPVYPLQRLAYRQLTPPAQRCLLAGKDQIGRRRMNCVSDILWKKPWLRISKPEERDIWHSPGKFDIVKDPFAFNHMADGDNYRRL